MPISIRRLLKKETVIESAGIIFLFTIIERIIRTFRGVIFARLLGPSEYGVFNLALFFIPLVVTLAKLGIPSCYVRYVPQYEKQGMLGDFFRKNYVLTIGVGVFITIIGAVFSKQISGLVYASNEHKHIIILCALSVIPYAVYEHLHSSFKGLRVFKFSAFLQFGQFFIFTAIGITLVMFSAKAESIIFANLISFIFVIAIFGFLFWKYIIQSSDQNNKIQENDFYIKIFKFSIWFIAMPIVTTLFKYTDRIMLNRFLGLEDVGIYSIAINVTQMLFMFGVIIGNIMSPNLARLWEKGERDRVISLLNLGVKINIIILLSFSVILALFKEPLISILYGQVYMRSVSVINILIISSIAISISWTIGLYAMLIEKPYIAFISNVSAFIANIILNYILIPHYQMQGAAIATTISFIINLTVMGSLFYKDGFRLKAPTIFLCILPICLLMGNMFLIIIFLTLMIVIISANIIINKDEKAIVFEQFRKSILKYKR